MINQSISGQMLIGHRMVGLVQNQLQFQLLFLLVLVLGAIKGHTLDWVVQPLVSDL